MGGPAGGERAPRSGSRPGAPAAGRWGSGDPRPRRPRGEGRQGPWSFRARKSPDVGFLVAHPRPPDSLPPGSPSGLPLGTRVLSAVSSEELGPGGPASAPVMWAGRSRFWIRRSQWVIGFPRRRPGQCFVYGAPPPPGKGSLTSAPTSVKLKPIWFEEQS